MITVLDRQRRLQSLGLYKGRLDGLNGPLTKAAVLAFQDIAKLVPDGIFGPMTSRALVQATTPAAPGRAEPDKSAIGGEIPPPAAAPVIAPAAPSNTIVIPDTARKFDELICHCSATPEGRDYTVADIRAWHKQRGWSDIGYHYVVYRDGRILPGRPLGQVGAHVAGRNESTVGVCYIGGLTADGSRAKDTRTRAQSASLLWFAGRLIAKYPAVRRVSGHNQYAAKACPSFDVRADPLGRIAG